MKKVLVSLLVGMTLCGGLFGCGNATEDTMVEYSYDEYQEFSQSYRDAETYLKGELEEFGYEVSLNEGKKTIEISYDTGDTSVSDLRDLGYDDEYIKQLGDFETLYSMCQVLAETSYDEVVAECGVKDINIIVEVKIGGETVGKFNQDGECVYSIF